MRGHPLLRFTGVAAVLLLSAGSVAAGGRFTLSGDAGTVGPDRVVVHPPRHRPVSRPFVHPFFSRPAVPLVVSPSPVVVYTPAPVVYVQPSPVVIVPVAPPPPMPSVIEYPNGRYELRGDGVTTPYRWVWIPKAPPPPAAPPEPSTMPPAADPLAPTGPTKQQGPAAPGEIYRWSDEEGVTHWTDRLDNVPERYRSRARRPTIAGR
ncbi:MAG TPA: hypothetical protein VFN71_12935 [Methylomirabilota bacterium]|nr:hypothetical protein [Methylomirabilota bacterium]